MSGLTIAYAALFYVATLTLIAGVVSKVMQYARTPAPLKIPTTPAPLTKKGVAWRLGKEVVLFESLFSANIILWVFAALFHAGLALALLRHVRYFQEPVWLPIQLIQTIGLYGGVAMVIGLALLLGRRILSERIRYISGPSDYLMLAMLLGIGISGLSMKFVAPTDILAVKAFCLGLLRFDLQPLPTDTNLLVHLGLVGLLMIVFPFSKLLHAPGVFFSPTRNQVDDAREKRHLAAWAAPLDETRSE